MTYTTQQIQDMVAAEALKQGVDPALALAVAANESSFNSSATSRAGAQGVMQLMPATAAWLGVNDSYDPQQNIVGGVKYLGMMLNQFGGDPRKALAAYNYGPTRVAAGEAWPSETTTYVGRVMNSWQQYGGEYGTPYPSTDPVPLLAGSGSGSPVWSIDVWGQPDGGMTIAGLGSSGTLLLILAAVVAMALAKR